MHQLKDYHEIGYHSQLSRYDHEEGFSDEQKEPQIIINNYQQIYQSTNILSKRKARVRIHEPKAKLKFIFNDQSSMKNSIQNVIANKQFHNRSIPAKSLQFRKKDSIKSSVIFQPLLKSKRTLIGQNLTIPNFALQDLRTIKQNSISEGLTIAFESARQINTHGYMKKICREGCKNFLQNKYNYLLKQRLKDSFIFPRKKMEEPTKNSNLKILFNSQIESGNLQLALQKSQTQYDLYLRIDTNTHGHQNWFNFEITSFFKQQQNIVFNICNLRRQFRLFQKGQKIFLKQFKEQKKDQKWQPAGTNIQVTQNCNPKLGAGRLFKLSFNLNLKPNKKYQIAMLPAYNYSEMIQKIQKLDQQHKNFVQVGLLSYSLTGLAIPIITITNKQTKADDKKVVLVSCRIHPGQSVSSIVVQGFIRRLLQTDNKQISQMLKTTIFKLVPMLNPDGVVFGNFRTNYLGIDLNRAFHTEDQILNPQVWSLKNLGRQLKTQYGANFVYFLDLHGHSSQKNIFAYGPNFQYNDPNFYVARLLPKVLNMKSKYFKYNSCSFKLQQHKIHTARGFFLNQLNIMTYTIQSSYCLYDDVDGITKQMKYDDWINFGMELVDGLQTSFKLKQANSIRSNKQLRNLLNANEIQQLALIKKIKSDVKKQINKSKIKLQDKQNAEDSDGQSQTQDLNEQQRNETEKKLLQFSIPSFSLPRVLKPAILYPTVTPKLFEVNQEKDQGSFKIIYTKRGKYNTLKMMNANNIYTNYLKNLDKLQKIKPTGRNMKLQKRVQI